MGAGPVDGQLQPEQHEGAPPGQLPTEDGPLADCLQLVRHPVTHGEASAAKVIVASLSVQAESGYMRVHNDRRHRDFVPVIAWTGNPYNNVSRLVTLSYEPSPSSDS